MTHPDRTRSALGVLALEVFDALAPSQASPEGPRARTVPPRQDGVSGTVRAGAEHRRRVRRLLDDLARVVPARRRRRPRGAVRRARPRAMDGRGHRAQRP